MPPSPEHPVQVGAPLPSVDDDHHSDDGTDHGADDRTHDDDTAADHGAGAVHHDHHDPALIVSVSQGHRSLRAVPLPRPGSDRGRPGGRR
jgi:hypothetical protein